MDTSMGPYDGVEPDDTQDPGFDPADYWDTICSGDDNPEDEDEEED